MSSILLAGHPGAGKSEVAGLLAPAAGLRTIDVGDLLWVELEDAGIAVTSRAEVGPRFIERWGRDGVTSLIRDELRRNGPAVVDAVRLVETANKLRREFHASIIFVDAAPEERRGRLVRRLRSPGFQGDLHKALAAYREYDDEQDELRGRSDIVVRNDGSPEALRQRVRRTIRAIERRPAQPAVLAHRW